MSRRRKPRTPAAHITRQARAIATGTGAPVEAVLFLTARALAAQLGIAPQTLRAWRHSGTGPAYVRLGASRVVYPLDGPNGIKEWAARRTFTSTAAATVAAEERHA